MTESEAIEVLTDKYTSIGTTKCDDVAWRKLKPAIDTAVNALEEIQQYQAIGTVEECREARERQRAKKYKIIEPCKSVTYYQCPCCNGLLHINENFCGECGQAISWEDV